MLPDGQQHFGIEDQGMFQQLQDVPSRAVGAPGYETTARSGVLKKMGVVVL